MSVIVVKAAPTHCRKNRRSPAREASKSRHCHSYRRPTRTGPVSSMIPRHSRYIYIRQHQSKNTMTSETDKGANNKRKGMASEPVTTGKEAKNANHQKEEETQRTPRSLTGAKRTTRSSSSSNQEDAFPFTNKEEEKQLENFCTAVFADEVEEAGKTGDGRMITCGLTGDQVRVFTCGGSHLLSPEHRLYCYMYSYGTYPPETMDPLVVRWLEWRMEGYLIRLDWTRLLILSHIRIGLTKQNRPLQS